MLGIIEEVYEAIFLARLSKVLFELTTIIGLDSLSYERCNISEFTEEIPAIGRGVGFVGIGEGKSGANVNGGKDIAFDTSRKDSHRVHLNEVAGVLRSKALATGFLLRRSSFSCQQVTSSAIDGDFVKSGDSAPFFEVMDDSTYGGFRYRFYSSQLTGGS